jgi:hypothetical protein
MADETDTQVITQKDSDRFRLAVEGPVPDAEGCAHPVLHEGQLIHGGRKDLPIVHMVCWDEDDPCRVSGSAEFNHVGDPSRPVVLQMKHSSESPVQMALNVQPLDHGLAVQTDLQSPIHHALQLKTPVQLRFVNPWEAASDYTVSVQLADRKLLQIQLTGKTVLTPQPAPPDSCLTSDPASPRVDTMVDLMGRGNS